MTTTTYFNRDYTFDYDHTPSSDGCRDDEPPQAEQFDIMALSLNHGGETINLDVSGLDTRRPDFYQHLLSECKDDRAVILDLFLDRKYQCMRE